MWTSYLPTILFHATDLHFNVHRLACGGKLCNTAASCCFQKPRVNTLCRNNTVCRKHQHRQQHNMSQVHIPSGHCCATTCPSARIMRGNICGFSSYKRVPSHKHPNANSSSHHINFVLRCLARVVASGSRLFVRAHQPQLEHFCITHALQVFLQHLWLGVWHLPSHEADEVGCKGDKTTCMPLCSSVSDCEVARLQSQVATAAVAPAKSAARRKRASATCTRPIVCRPCI